MCREGIPALYFLPSRLSGIWDWQSIIFISGSLGAHPTIGKDKLQQAIPPGLQETLVCYNGILDTDSEELFPPFLFLTNKGKYTTHTGYSSRAVVDSCKHGLPYALASSPGKKSLSLQNTLGTKGSIMGLHFLCEFINRDITSPMLISYH